ncbi:MAG: amino acid adenylation domain-containing protein [Bacteroidetes bacterium]|nr:amino acid adenylation domain-containing protein [Bacteroidota bacterium]
MLTISTEPGMNGTTAPENIEFWKNYLSGIPEMLQLPLDFQRPKQDQRSTSDFRFSLPTELYDRLKTVTGFTETSFHDILLAAFGVLISKYSLQDDLVIGWSDPEKENSPVIPMRLIIPTGMSFTDVAAEVIKQTKFLPSDARVPFEEVAAELNLNRNANVHPVFQVLFNYRSESGNSDVPSLPVDLSFNVSEVNRGFDCVATYDAGLFNKVTIERIAGHYTMILNKISANPAIPAGEIPILTNDEFSQIIYKWNSTRTPYPREKCVHHLFEEQAARTPDNIAVEDDHTRLTYRELNEKANRLARHLLKHGAGEDKVIGVFLHRNVNLLVSLLAISKTGSTYLPLDPIYPKPRLELILNDAKPVLSITEHSLLGHLPDTGANPILPDEEQYSSESAENLALGNPLKPAYILYTSGSTGKPKGVPVLQHSLVNLINAFTKMMKIVPEDIYLSVTTISFDIAELDMYLPLFNGARVVIASQETAMDMELLIKRFESSQATLFQATPVTYKMLLLNNWQGKSDLRVITGGDATTKEQGRKLLAICKEVWNCYGPTETTIYSTGGRVMPEDVAGEGIVNIGRPLDNNFIYILNSSGIPVPGGIPGELYIGGDGVSPGYIDLPELTAGRFVPDPFCGGPDGKMYRSGDLARFLPDGRLAFLNRVDSQVKIRGFRIELGEIETVLSQYPGIRENVVMVRQDPSGENMLAAYYTCSKDDEINSCEIREFLMDRLPDYMVPAAFVRMEKFPLTANNKVDRKALPDPEPQSGIVPGAADETGTPTEAKLTEIWKSLLNIGHITIHEDFFRIGGHSLMAVNLIIKIEKEFGIRLSLIHLFDNPTVHLQAVVLDKANGSGQDKTLAVA